VIYVIDHFVCGKDRACSNAVAKGVGIPTPGGGVMHPPELPPHNPLQSGSPLAHLPNSNGACCTTHNTPQRYQALQLQLHSTVATGPRGTKQSVTNHPPPSPTCLCTIPGNLGYTAIHTLSLNARMMLSYADCHPGQILVNGTCQQLHGKTTVGPIQAQTKMRV
jgi:hypothetical protein